MNHLDTIHERWQGFLNGLWCSIVKRLNEFLKSLKIFDIVFGFVESFGDSELNTSPFGGSKINFVSGLGELLRWLLRGLRKHIINSSAVLTAQLLRDTSKLSHSLLPVVELLLGSSILLFLFVVVVSVVECFLDELTPLIEDLFKIGDHLWVWLLLSIFGISLPLSWKLLESNVHLQAFERLFELTGELFEARVELLLLLVFADTPCLVVKPVDEWLVHLVDDGVKRCHGMS